MAKRVIASFDGWQRRNAAGGFAVAVLKKFNEDRASNFATQIAYYAFFSLFPLLLALVSVLGFVLEGNPTLREDVLDTALARIPVIGAQLADEVHPLTGSGVALAVGLAAAVWAGLGVTLALGRAFAEIWDVPRMNQPSGVTARARGLAVLVILAATLVASTAATGLSAGGGIGAAGERGAAIVVSLAANVAVFLTVFALLTPRPRQIRDLLPGVALAAAGGLVLQSIGGWYVDRTIKDASATYGTFAAVIGLLSWFWLAAHLLLVAAEVNVVRRWRMWPRSLTGELEPADRLALRRSAVATRADRRQRIAVSFREDDPPGGAGLAEKTDTFSQDARMASYSLNDSAVEHARRLIEARQYVLESDWGEVQPRAGDENAFLESHSWEDYANWHLGLTDGATDETKARYAFVYGDFRRVHRMGLIACHYRAAEWRHKDIELAAHELLQLLDSTAA